MKDEDLGPGDYTMVAPPHGVGSNDMLVPPTDWVQKLAGRYPDAFASEWTTSQIKRFVLYLVVRSAVALLVETAARESSPAATHDDWRKCAPTPGMPLLGRALTINAKYRNATGPADPVLSREDDAFFSRRHRRLRVLEWRAVECSRWISQLSQTRAGMGVEPHGIDGVVFDAISAMCQPGKVGHPKAGEQAIGQRGDKVVDLFRGLKIDGVDMTAAASHRQFFRRELLPAGDAVAWSNRLWENLADDEMQLREFASEARGQAADDAWWRAEEALRWARGHARMQAYYVHAGERPPMCRVEQAVAEDFARWAVERAWGEMRAAVSAVARVHVR